MPKSLNLEEFLPYQLSILSNTVSGAIAEHYARPLHLNMTQWRVLAIVAETPECSADAVAARAEMDKGTVSRAVAALLRRGFLKRRFSADDRRRSKLMLSARGMAVYERVAPQAIAYEEDLLREFSATDQKQLLSLLRRLLDRARLMRAEGR